MRERGAFKVPFLSLRVPSCPEVEEKGPVRDIGQVASPLGASVSSSVKWGNAKDWSDDMWETLVSGLRVLWD